MYASICNVFKINIRAHAAQNSNMEGHNTKNKLKV